MKNVDAFRLDRLKLQNFRCFEECSIVLHPQLTVLVAENGQGKTAVLDGIRIALGLFVGTISGAQQLPGFDRSDVHLVKDESGLMVPALPTELVADGFVTGKAIHWRRVLSDYSLRARTTTKEARLLSSYRALIEDGHAERDDAQSLRSKLKLHFGESHPLIVDCDRLIRFQKFKISKNNPPEEVAIYGHHQGRKF